MREPITNAESDDVVASVRRLVSREAEGTPPPRLLLSAALRVPEERAAALAAERGEAVANAPRPANDATAALRAVPRDPEPADSGVEGSGPEPLTPLLLRDRVDTPAPEPAAEAPPAARPDEAAAPVDPDALRGLVAELVREELHGVMGERVTRNLRKLVRREVARAIASREAAARES